MAKRQTLPATATVPSRVLSRTGSPKPPSGGRHDNSVWLALGSIALVGTYFAASWAGTWAAGIGQTWVEAVLGGSIGGGDGGDPPCKNLPSWICSVADFDVLR